jgi:hypothetical protein
MYTVLMSIIKHARKHTIICDIFSSNRDVKRLILNGIAELLNEEICIYMNITRFISLPKNHRLNTRIVELICYESTFVDCSCAAVLNKPHSSKRYIRINYRYAQYHTNGTHYFVSEYARRCIDCFNKIYFASY